jgi:hypothetical protein
MMDILPTNDGMNSDFKVVGEPLLKYSILNMIIFDASRSTATMVNSGVLH